MDKILKVYIKGIFIAWMQPGSETENKKVLSIYNTYLIEATDTEGIVTYSKEFNLDDLDMLDWKVIIKGGG